jgi:hypothetical protein
MLRHDLIELCFSIDIRGHARQQEGNAERLFDLCFGDPEILCTGWARTACWSRRAAAIAMAISFFVFFDSFPSSQMCCSNLITRLNISGSFVVNSRKNFGTFPIFFSRVLSFLSVPFVAAVVFAGVFLAAVFFATINLLTLQLHRFAAADKFAAAGLFYNNNVATDLTPEDLPLF